MKILAIIVTYNGEKWIDKCFNSLSNNTLDIDIIVIDNASKDNTVNLIKKSFPKVEVIESKENLGFGKANNIGLKKALDKNFDYAFLLNQDAWVEPETIEKLIAISKTNPNYGVLSPIHLNGEKKLMDNNFFRYITTSEKSREFFTQHLMGISPVVFEVDFVNAALWLITKECIESVGGFDPIFSHYGEDDNYLHRCIFHGFKTGVVPNTFGFHDREYRKQQSKDRKELLHGLNTSFLVKMANINKESSKIDNLKSNHSYRIIIQCVRNILGMKYILAKRNFQHYNQINKFYKKALKSREKTIKRGSLYLQ